MNIFRMLYLILYLVPASRRDGSATDPAAQASYANSMAFLMMFFMLLSPLRLIFSQTYLALTGRHYQEPVDLMCVPIAMHKYEPRCIGDMAVFYAPYLAIYLPIFWLVYLASSSRNSQQEFNDQHVQRVQRHFATWRAWFFIFLMATTIIPLAASGQNEWLGALLTVAFLLAGWLVCTLLVSRPVA